MLGVASSEAVGNAEDPSQAGDSIPSQFTVYEVVAYYLCVLFGVAETQQGVDCQFLGFLEWELHFRDDR